MLTYEIDNINRGFENFTIDTCSRTPQEAL